MKIIFFLCLFCLSFNSKARPTNKELSIGITQEFENFNPLIMSMMATSYMYRLTGRTLVILDRNGQWQTQLAREIPTLKNGLAKIIHKNGQKKVRAKWTIKKKASWGDGTPLTCHDFKFSWNVAKKETVSIAEKKVYTQVESIDIDPDNPKKCTFTYQQAKWDFNRLASFYPVPKHLEAPIFKKHSDRPEGYEKNSNYTKNPTNPGLFSGPYLIEEIKLGSHVTFKRNPHFYSGQAHIEKIVIKLIPNTGTLEANLRSGTIDMISTLGMSFDQALAFNKKVKKNGMPYQVKFKPSLVYEHLDINLDHPALKDLQVRKALVYAINREGLTKALFEGKQPPALHNLAPLDPWFTSNPDKIVVYRHSRRKANRILNQAGWKRNEDGIREKDGVKLSFDLMTTSGNRIRELVQVYLQDQWKSIGIDIEIKNEPARVFFGKTTRRRQFDGLALFAWISSPESNPRSTTSSQSIPNDENGWSGQNYPGWHNERVDKLVNQLDLEFNEKKRLEIIHEILYHYTNEVPVIPLYYRSDVSVIPENLKGHRITGHQFGATNKVENWRFVEKKNQKKGEQHE